MPAVTLGDVKKKYGEKLKFVLKTQKSVYRLIQTSMHRTFVAILEDSINVELVFLVFVFVYG